MKVEREIAAHETQLAGIDVIGLELRVRVGVKALAERALVVGVFHENQRRIVLADGKATGRERHADLVALRLRLRLARCRRDGALLQRFPNRLELVQNLLRLLRCDALSAHQRSAAKEDCCRCKRGQVTQESVFHGG